MDFNEKLKDNWEKDLSKSFDEPDIIKLRSKLENIRELFDERLSNYSMNTSEQEGRLN